MLARSLAVLVAVCLAACGDDGGNPFAGSGSRAASADSVLMFVSGSWADVPGQPRELLASNADGTKIERLTTCGPQATACDFLRFAVSPDRTRVAAVRTTPGAEPGASALYFMDLGRSVEQLLFARRRVAAVDWSPDGSSLIYQSTGDQASEDDSLFLCEPNGDNDQALDLSAASTPPVRERNPRFDSASRNAVYERIDGNGASRIYFFPATPLTSGPAGGQALPGTPYLVGGDADPAFSPDTTRVVFRRLTGVGNEGLGTWDLLTIQVDGTDERTLVSGAAFRGAPDWGSRGIAFVETDAASDESRLVVIQADGTGRTVLRTERADFGMAAPRWIRGS